MAKTVAVKGKRMSARLRRELREGAARERSADEGLRFFADMYGATRDPARLENIEALAAEHDRLASGHSFAAALLRETLRAVRTIPSPEKE